MQILSKLVHPVKSAFRIWDRSYAPSASILNFPECRIDSAVGTVSLVEDRRTPGSGLDGLRSAHDSIAGFIDGAPIPGAGSSQYRSAICRALFGLHHLHRMSIHVGLNLAPQI